MRVNTMLLDLHWNNARVALINIKSLSSKVIHSGHQSMAALLSPFNRYTNLRQLLIRYKLLDNEHDLSDTMQASYHWNTCSNFQNCTLRCLKDKTFIHHTVDCLIDTTGQLLNISAEASQHAY